MPATRTRPIAVGGAPADAVLDDRFPRVATALIFLYPLFWMIGLAPGFWILLGIAGAAHLARARWNVDTRSVLLIPLLLLISIPVGAIRFGADPTRILSAFANVLVWVAVAAIVNSISPSPARRTRVAQALVCTGIAQGLLIAVSALIYPAKLPVPLLAPLLSGAPQGIRVFATNGLYYADWLNGAAFRSQGIMGNATWNGAVGAITVLLGVAGIVRWRGRWRIAAVVAVVAGLLSLQTSLSRSTTIAIVAAAIAAAWIALRKRHPHVWIWITAAAALGVVLALVFGMDAVMDQFARINDERAGSALSRGEIYSATLQYIQQSPFPAIGYGLKPEDDGLVASVATHSTYLGILFRAGVVGAAALVLLYVRGFVGSIRRASPLGLGLMTFIALWCVFEDVDAGHFVPLAFAFVFAGDAAAATVADTLEQGDGSRG